MGVCSVKCGHTQNLKKENAGVGNDKGENTQAALHFKKQNTIHSPIHWQLTLLTRVAKKWRFDPRLEDA